MENFIVSARKYRPATFETVVGQKSITTTLKNAIKNKQLAHAYLFCGPRGVGKTTCARIFAKTINCNFLTPELEACDVCESCKAFNSSRSYNIHELDAASNNSVEDIRNLIDQVRIPPQIGSHSVYIIDEVHMLSTQAFNAFLKTLEEPPGHAIFILATTEKHKILATILSRCQIFDFNRIKVEDIVEHLASVANREGVDADNDGLNVIAQKADGGMRDALSFFDQIVSFSGKKITYKAVIENLNVLDYDYYFKLTYSFIENNIPAALLIFNEVLSKGFDAHHFISGLSGHFRDLLVCKDVSTLELLEVGATIRENYKKQAQEATVDFLIKALALTNTCDLNYREAKNKRLLVELTLVQLCQITALQTQQRIQNTQQPVIQQQSTQQPVIQQQSVQQPIVQQPIVQQPVIQQNTVQNPVNQQVNVQQVKDQSKSPTLSIKDLLNQSVNKQPENKNANLVNDQQAVYQTNQNSLPVTQENIHIQWLEFAQSIQQIKPRIFSTLQANIPVLKNDFIIELSVANQLLEEAVTEIKPELLHRLRAVFGNPKIDLKIIITTEKPKTKLYSNVDKFKYLNDKNSNLDKLRQQFNLDF